jgi:nucleoside-diphosphate-sugar epimerase
VSSELSDTQRNYPLIIVTGAAGWLGRRVVSALTAGTSGEEVKATAGTRLRCLCAPHESTQELLEAGAEIVVGDLRDPDTRLALFKDAEGALVLHLAGVIHPTGGVRTFDEVNHRGTLDILAAAANTARMVVMSSNSPFGANPSPDQTFNEDSPYNPYMNYGLSKMRMELGLRAAMERPGGPEIVIVRAPWFYGPGQPPRQGVFFTMCQAGKFPLMGKGMNRRSMGYVDSLALGILLAGQVPKAAGEIYWLADESAYTMHEIVDTVRTVLKEDFGLPLSPKTLHVPAVIADVARIVDKSLQTVGIYHQKFHVLSEMNLTIACDISKAKRELGYTPMVELREGMRRSVKWWLDFGQTN